MDKKRKKKTGIQTVYNGKAYHSLSALAEEIDVDLRILSKNYAECKDISEAVRKSIESERNPISLWGQDYTNMMQLSKNFGISADAIRYQMRKGVNIETAVSQILFSGGIHFQNKRYESLTQLCSEYHMQPSNIRYRIKNGWSLQRALLTPIDTDKTGEAIEYDGKWYPSRMAVCREYDIAYDCVNKLSRKTKDWGKAFDFFVWMKQVSAIAEDTQIDYVPRCVIRGKPYKALRNLTDELNISETVVKNYKKNNHFSNIIECLRSMQLSTTAKGALKYPVLRDFDFGTGCCDTNLLYQEWLESVSDREKEVILEQIM